MVEVFSVKPTQVVDIADQPKKTILGLYHLIDYRARETLFVREMNSEEPAQRLV